jgi:hypothetical protein
VVVSEQVSVAPAPLVWLHTFVAPIAPLPLVPEISTPEIDNTVMVPQSLNEGEALTVTETLLNVELEKARNT